MVTNNDIQWDQAIPAKDPQLIPLLDGFVFAFLNTSSSTGLNGYFEVEYKVRLYYPQPSLSAVVLSTQTPPSLSVADDDAVTSTFGLSTYFSLLTDQAKYLVNYIW